MKPDRRSQLEEELDRVLPILVRDYHARRVLLFGSMVTSPIGEWSDLDLVVIKESSDRFLDRIAQALDMIKPRLGLDLLVYTPDEWRHLRETSPYVREEIDGKARVLYAG